MKRREFLQTTLSGIGLLTFSPLMTSHLMPRKIGKDYRISIHHLDTRILLADQLNPYDLLAGCASNCGAATLSALPSNIDASDRAATEQGLQDRSYTDTSQTQNYMYKYVHSDNSCETYWYPAAYESSLDLAVANYRFIYDGLNARNATILQMVEILGFYMISQAIVQSYITLPSHYDIPKTLGDMFNPIGGMLQHQGDSRIFQTNGPSASTYRTNNGTVTNSYDPEKKQLTTQVQGVPNKKGTINIEPITNHIDATVN